MRILSIILAVIAALIAIVLSALPFGLIALIPSAFALLFGYIGYRLSKKDQKLKQFSHQLILLLILVITLSAIALTIYREMTNENTVEVDTEFIEKEKESKEDAIEELEGIEGLEEDIMEDIDTNTIEELERIDDSNN